MWVSAAILAGFVLGCGVGFVLGALFKSGKNEHDKELLYRALSVLRKLRERPENFWDTTLQSEAAVVLLSEKKN